MHLNTLSPEQHTILPFLSGFGKRFYLVGGTAIALHLGHRESIDFDLFTEKPFSTAVIYRKLLAQREFRMTLIRREEDQLHCTLNGVKVTFFEYPFRVPLDCKMPNGLRYPSLLTLAAMKAFALGGRAKWKDYVDLYFILRDYFTLQQVSDHARSIFTDAAFSSRMFREQLAYYADVNYSEEVIYLNGCDVTEDEVKTFLTKVAIQPLA